jgi:hypothetical protein
VSVAVVLVGAGNYRGGWIRTGKEREGGIRSKERGKIRRKENKKEEIK